MYKKLIPQFANFEHDGSYHLKGQDLPRGQQGRAGGKTCENGPANYVHIMRVLYFDLLCTL
jgi:hypothetical protein